MGDIRCYFCGAPTVWQADNNRGSTFFICDSDYQLRVAGPREAGRFEGFARMTWTKIPVPTEKELGGLASMLVAASEVRERDL